MTISTLQKTFNQAAKSYDGACQLQQETGKVLINLLSKECPYAETILDAGCGTGIVTKQLVSTLAYQNCDAIDIAEKLLCEAKKKLLGINIYQADFNISRSTTYDLIFGNLSLHWSVDFNHTLQVLLNQLKTNGILAFSIPLTGTFQEIEPYCNIQRFFDINEIKSLLFKQQLHLIRFKTHILKFEFENLSKALKSIKATGTHAVTHANKTMNFTQLRHTLQKKSRVNLSYHIGYFVCQKNIS